MLRLVTTFSCLLVVLAGCGNPATSKLAVGSKAIVVDAYGGKYDRVYLSRATEGMLPGLVLGTHVTVVEDNDNGKRSEIPEAVKGRGLGTRTVVVHVEDGEYKGVTGELARQDLHPE